MCTLTPQPPGFLLRHKGQTDPQRLACSFHQYNTTHSNSNPVAILILNGTTYVWLKAKFPPCILTSSIYFNLSFDQHKPRRTRDLGPLLPTKLSQVEERQEQERWTESKPVLTRNLQSCLLLCTSENRAFHKALGFSQVISGGSGCRATITSGWSVSWNSTYGVFLKK